MNRRRFLSRTGAVAAGAFSALATPAWVHAAPAPGKTRIRVVYSLHGPQQSGPDWPNKGFDFVPVMDRIEQSSRRLAPDSSLSVPGDRARASKKILEATREGHRRVPGVQMNCWNRVVQTIATSGKPVLYADFQFGGSGGFSCTPRGFSAAKRRMSDSWRLRTSRTCGWGEVFDVVKKGGSMSDFVRPQPRSARSAHPKRGTWPARTTGWRAFPRRIASGGSGVQDPRRAWAGVGRCR